MQKSLLIKFNILFCLFVCFDKNPLEREHRGDLPQHNKYHKCQVHTNIILKGGKLKVFPLRRGTR